MCPILFQFGGFRLPSYSAFAELGALLVFSFVYVRRDRMGLRGPDDFWLLLDTILLGGFAGGRLGYLATDPGLPPFQWRDLVFPLTSGFSAFGVFAGMAAGVLVLCRLRRLPLGRVADHLGAAMPFWMATSRLGCHLTGCCQGRPAGPSWPWTVTFTDPASACPPALLGVPLHPAQLYEALGDVVLGLVLVRLLGGTERDGLPSGWCAAGFLAGYGTLRFALEAVRADGVPWLGPFSLGQVCAGGCVLVGLLAARWSIRAGRAYA